MQTLTIRPSETQFPYEFECQNCRSFKFRFDSKKIRQAPWECGVCDEVYIPCPDTVENPTDIALRIIRGNAVKDMKCIECEESFDRDKLEESLKDLIENGNPNTEGHVLYQIHNPEDMVFWECPKCGEPVDFLQKNRPK